MHVLNACDISYILLDRSIALHAIETSNNIYNSYRAQVLNAIYNITRFNNATCMILFIWDIDKVGSICAVNYKVGSIFVFKNILAS